MIHRLRRIWANAGVLAELISTGGFVEDLTPDHLKKLGAEAVIFDHDGVLGVIRSNHPDETGAHLLHDALEVFGEGRVFILSNTKSSRTTRRDAYNEAYKKVVYLMAKRKPDPEGLKMASSLSGVPFGKIAMVDDGILTGGLMAVENGAIPIYVTRRSLKENAAEKAGRLLVTLPQIALVRLAVFLKKLTGP